MIRLVSSLACPPFCLLGPSLALCTAPSVNAMVDRIPAVPREATWTWWNKP